MHFSEKTHKTFFEVLEKTFICFMEVPSIKIKRVMTKKIGSYSFGGKKI